MRSGLEVWDEEWTWRCGMRMGLEVCDEEWLGGV